LELAGAALASEAAIAAANARQRLYRLINHHKAVMQDMKRATMSTVNPAINPQGVSYSGLWKGRAGDQSLGFRRVREEDGIFLGAARA
jgi:hypothetical protein